MGLIEQNKDFLRKKFLKQRQKYDIIKYREADEAIISTLIKIVNSIAKNNPIGLYWPLYGEPNLLKLSELSSDCCLPKIKNKKMMFVRYNLDEQMEKNEDLNFMQPITEVELIPKVIIVPGVAF